MKSYGNNRNKLLAHVRELWLSGATMNEIVRQVDLSDLVLYLDVINLYQELELDLKRVEHLINETEV